MRNLIAFVVVSSLVACASTGSGPASEKISDRDAVRETIDRVYIATDEKDWPTIRRLFAPRVSFDMSSLSGAPESQETPESIAAMWEKGLKEVPLIHHQSGNFLVDVQGDEATVKNYAMATHHFPNAKKGAVRTRWFVGSYDWHLRRTQGAWKIDLFRFRKQYVDEVK